MYDTPTETLTKRENIMQVSLMNTIECRTTPEDMLQVWADDIDTIAFKIIEADGDDDKISTDIILSNDKARELGLYLLNLVETNEKIESELPENK